MLSAALEEETATSRPPPQGSSSKALPGPPNKPNFAPPAPPMAKEEGESDRMAVQLKPIEAQHIDPNLHVIEDPSLGIPGGGKKEGMLSKASLTRAFTFGGTTNTTLNNDADSDDEDRKSDLDTWLDAPPPDPDTQQQYPNAKNTPFYKKMSSGALGLPQPPSFQALRSSFTQKMSNVQRPSFTFSSNGGSNSNSNGVANRASAMFSDLHKRSWLKKSASLPVRRSSVSKYISIHGVLEEMVKRKLDKIKLQRALCAKNLTMDQKDAVRAFMRAAVTESSTGQDVVIEGDTNVCRVMHPFEAQDEWQMTVLAGETVFVKKRLQSGWWAVARVNVKEKKVMKGKGNSGILPGICCDWGGKIYSSEVKL